MDIFNFKCKYCGGEMSEVDGLKSVGKCKYCGSKQTLPKLHDEKRANLFERANHLRRNNEFDKAEALYEQILNDDLSDPEAYWSLVLCRYGIEYVEDTRTKERVPTVNRTQMTSIFGDEDYKSAIKNADDEQRKLYEEEARIINEIQKGILEISRQEAPFDIFICYKETDLNGRRSRDSVLAQDLYHELTRDGYKVFFARVTLQGKLGSAYEPYIFSALNSSKVMVVLGTQKEHFEAVWVRNEWSRFLGQIKKGERKVLIPAYRDMDAYDLPVEFSNLQALDMGRLGFMQELVMAIENILASYKKSEKRAETESAPSYTPAPEIKRAPEAKKEKKKKKKGGAVVLSIIALILVAAIATGVLAATGVIKLPFDIPFLSGSQTEGSGTEGETSAPQESNSKLAFTKLGSGYHVTGIGSETATDIKIPATYMGLPVTAIDYGAFQNCVNIKTVTIPENVTQIGTSAFEGCTGLERVTIPKSVTKISANAFKNCTKLATISYRGTAANWNSITFESGWNSGMTKYTIACSDNDIVVGGGEVVTSGQFEVGVEYHAYVDQKASGKKLYLKGTMNTYFLEGSENAADAVSVYFESAGEGKYHIYLLIDGAKQYINIKEEPGENDVYLNITLGTTPSAVWTWNETIKTVITVFNGHELFIATKPENATYTNASALRVDAWGATAYPLQFEKAEGDTSDIAAEGEWGTNAIYTLSENGTLTFSGVGMLESPDGGADAANPWENVQSKTRAAIKVKKIVVESGITGIGAYLFANLDALESVDLADSVTHIYLAAFAGSSLKSIKANGALEISEDAFQACTRLEAISFPKVTYVDVDAFNSCRGLKTVNLPAAITLAAGAFSECDALTTVDLPSIQTLQSNAFAKSTGLTTLYLGTALTEIGSKVFENCTNVAINYAGTAEQWALVAKSGDWNTYLDESKMKYESTSSSGGTSGGNTTTDYNDPDKVTGSAITQGVAYNLAFYSPKLGAKYYLTGEMTGSYNQYFAATTDPTQAATVYIENSGIPNDFYIYFDLDGTKYYINIYENTTNGKLYHNPILQTEASSGWCWSTDECLSAPFDGEGYFLGTAKAEAYDNIGLVPEATKSPADYNVLYFVPDADYNGGTSSGGSSSGNNGVESNAIHGNIEHTYQDGDAAISTVTYYDLTEDGVLTISGNGQMPKLDSYPWSSKIVTRIIIEEGITSVSYAAFQYLTKLTSVTIPSSVTKIDGYAFNKCTGLAEVVGGHNVTEVGYHAFSRTSIVNNSSAENPFVLGQCLIGVNTSVAGGFSLSENVTYIAPQAFHGCSGLTEVAIPTSVNYIGTEAFYLSGITTIQYSGTTTEWANITKASNWDSNSGKTITVNCSDGTVSSGSSSGSDSGTVTPVSNGEYDIGVAGDETVVNGVRYKLYTNPQTNKQYYEVVGCSADTTDIVIPSQINNIDVTSIAAFAFKGNTTLYSVKFDCDKLTYVGLAAFEGCEILTNVDMSGADSLTFLPSHMFYQCNLLQTVKLPNNLTSIGTRVFSNQVITDGYKESLNNCLVMTIYDNAYYLGSVQNPYLILMRAVAGNYTSFVIHNDTKLVYNGAFGKCDSNKISYNTDGANKYLGTPNNKYFLLMSGTDSNINSNTKIIYNSAFRGSSISQITIPSGVVSIGEYAFFNCGNLSSISLPSSLENMGQEMFTKCSSLTSLTIPEKVRLIGNSMFYRSGLTQLTFMGDVVSFGANMSEGCNINLTLPTSVREIDDNSFAGVQSVTYKGTEEQWNSIWKAANISCPTVTYTGTSNIPSNSGSSGGSDGSDEVTSEELNDGTFRYRLNADNKTCAVIGCVDTPSGTIEIPANFQGMVVNEIADEAFMGQTGITHVILPTQLVTIGRSAFERCTSLAQISIWGNRLTTIGEAAFKDCRSLTNFTVPAYVTNIGAYAFSGCTGLKKVIFTGREDTVITLQSEDLADVSLSDAEQNAINLSTTYADIAWTFE